jgi:hypothetical protein
MFTQFGIAAGSRLDTAHAARKCRIGDSLLSRRNRRPMRSLIIGLGKSGAGLHLPVLLRLPGTRVPVVGVDPAGVPDVPGLLAAPSIVDAARLLDPRDTVVHVCTPPTARVRVLTELAARPRGEATRDRRPSAGRGAGTAGPVAHARGRAVARQ